MKLAVILCVLFHVSLYCDDNVIFYFGVHKEPTSKMIAATLNSFTEGIALHIPVPYLKKAVALVSLAYIVWKLYKSRTVLSKLNEPIPPCLCDMCLEMMSQEIES